MYAWYLHASLANLLVRTMSNYLPEKGACMQVSYVKRLHDSGTQMSAAGT